MFDAGAGSTEMNLFASAARGMNEQRSLLDIAARNVAAAQAATPDHPYARLVAHFGGGPENDGTAAVDAFDPDADDAAISDAPAMIVGREPGTGDALGEMIAVLDAQRAYEQNASVFDTAKRLAERTIDIGRS
jgi:flagellar basal body rod protein FlgC